MTEEESRYFDEFKYFFLEKVDEFERSHGGPRVCWNTPSNVILLKAKMYGWAADYEKIPHFHMSNLADELAIKNYIVEHFVNML